VQFSTDTSPGDVSGWGAYVAGVYWAVRSAGHELTGADLSLASSVPRGAGLSSSAALECALMVALNDMHNLRLDRTSMALLAQRAENEYVGAPTGSLDQMAAMHGREGHVVLLDAQATTADLVPCDLAASGLAILIVDTRVRHQHVDGEYGARRATCESAARTLGVKVLRDVQDDNHSEVLAALGDDLVAVRRVRHILTENRRVLETVELLHAGRLRDVGPLLTASHTSMREDYEITVPEVDIAVEALLDVGAHGARMTGGGFGGSVIGLIDAEATQDAAAAVAEAFARQSFQPPYSSIAAPSAGAGHNS
jgi:galactokinase